MTSATTLHGKQLQAEKTGFTLVELALVMVIIGLIVGGVLVGRDLIKASEIRSTTVGLERYNAAAITFRNKYNGLPGDLLAVRASQFGFIPRSDASAHGDNNKVIEGCTANSVYLGCETGLFWADLSIAQLINDAFTDASDNLLTAATIAETGAFLPAAPLRETAFISLYPQGGRNYFLIASFSDINNGVQTFSLARAQALTVFEAAQMDDKIDDGAPLTGNARAVADWNVGGASGVELDAGAVAGTGVCIDQGAAASVDGDETYNLVDENIAAELNCALSIRTSF